MVQSDLSVKHFNAQNHSIVIWSEAKHYWNTFAPIVKYLNAHKIDFVYLASDINDMGLFHTKNNICIGTGRKSFNFLNKIKANVLICTTPNLGDLAFKRSPLVKHYIHTVHAPTDMHTYRRVAFECFDTVMCAGQHQINTIRTLEKLRGTEQKNLLETGCLYYDNITLQNTNTNKSQSRKKTILIAPTWGQNNILQYADDVIPRLLSNNYNIIIRPHPQSLKSDKKLLSNIQSKYPQKNISWDFESSGDTSMASSDLMIGYMSGILFDYAFIHKKPIVIIDDTVDYTDMEGADISNLPPWEIEMKNIIATPIDLKNIKNIATYINKSFTKKVPPNLGNKHLFNFTKSGEVAGKQILDIVEKVRGN